MTPGELGLHLEAYMALQRALGFPLGAREKLLRDFVTFIEKNGFSGSIQAQVALDWACSASERCGLSGKTARLTVARRFLLHLSAVAPGIEVPRATLLARPLRRKPFLFSAEELSRLLKAALALGPQGSLRPHTLSTLLGLMASSGLRASEALKLSVRDVLLDLEPPRLQIRKTKFHNYDGLSDYFFVSEQGSRLAYKAFNDTFQKLVRGLGLEARDGSRRPSLHSLRHGFAVDCLRTWYQQGIDVGTQLPHLSVYLGHLGPVQTYWYLSATPELLSEAAGLFATYAGAGGEP
jgi:integrase